MDEILSSVENQRVIRLQKLSLLCSILVGLIGLAVLIGWHFHIDFLKSIVPGLLTMKPNTALAFLLTSSTLLLLHYHSPIRNLFSRLFSILIFCIGFFTLLEYFTNYNFHIDQLLFQDTTEQFIHPPGRMAPITAIVFMLIGIALFSIRKECKILCQTIAVLVGLFGLLILSGLTFQLGTDYKLVPYIYAGIHSAINFILIGIAIIFLKPNCGIAKIFISESEAGKVARIFIPLAIFVPIILGYIRIWGQQQGFYDTESSVTFLVTTTIAISLFYIFFTLIMLSKSDIKRKTAEEDLIYLAKHDKLTGLFSRFEFEKIANQEILLAQESQSRFAILFFDLDLFKKINDSFGHITGDQVLNKIAARLRLSLRESDIIARFGGDEFIILVRDSHNIENIKSLAKKILTIVSNPIHIRKHEIYITASIGISIYPKDGKTVNDLMKKADQAMYFAKELGRNNYQFAKKNMTAFTKAALLRETQLRYALENNQMILYFQPIAEVNSLRIVGAEALIRWQHPSGILLPPNSFLSLASQSDMIVNLGDWVLKTAYKEFCSWHKLDLKFTSINLSSHQLNNQLVNKIQNLLKKTSIQAQQICIELTENSLLEISDKNISLINRLKSLGVKIAIDDFGTGYSSLTYINSFKVDVLKIDQSFIATVPSNLNSVAIVSTILAMAKTLEIEVIAEGVETPEHLNFLREKGCDLFQGFYLTPPLPAKEFCEFVIQHNKKLK